MAANNSPKTVALFYPQWQGAGYAPDLFHGTVALWDYFSAEIPSIMIPVERLGELNKQNDIIGFKQIDKQLFNAYKALQELNSTRIVAIGGGCDVEVAVVSCLSTMHGPMGVFWFDAHGDLNTPESSSSHLFHGMALRCLIEGGRGFGLQMPVPSISLRDIALLGVRDLDPPEKEYIENTDIMVITVDELRDSISENFVSQFRKFEKVYIHIDLDVLDPVEFAGVKCPTANGMRIKQLSSVLEDIMERWDVIGFSLVENIEIDKGKLSVLDPIIDLARKFGGQGDRCLV